MSLLGLLNFVVLQWLCVRLEVSFTCVCPPGVRHRWWDREIAVDDKVAFSLIRWIVPLTGWWSSYRWIGARR